MKARSIFLYQWADPEAIRDVAQSRSAWWVGGLLVISSGIAREYDQTLFSLYGIRVFLPLIVSFVAATFLRAVLRTRLQKGTEQSTNFSQDVYSLRTFLGLFWMTAPMAWVYAFPAERYFDTRTAAQINVGLLALVAAWRVTVFSRALVLLTGLGFLDILSALLLPSSLLMGLGSIGVSLSLVRMMGGLRHSPEESVLGIASGITFFASTVIFLLSLGTFLYFRRRKPRGRLLSPPTGEHAPWKTLAGIFLFWTLISIVPQLEVARTERVRTLIKQGKFKDALSFLSARTKGDFSPVLRLPPDPYEYHGLDTLPKVFQAMDGSEAPWVQAYYLNHLEIAYRHEKYRHRTLLFLNHESFCIQLKGLARLPTGREWAKKHRQKLITAHDNLSELNGLDAEGTRNHQQRRRLLGQLGLEVPALSRNTKATDPREPNP